VSEQRSKQKSTVRLVVRLLLGLVVLVALLVLASTMGWWETLERLVGAWLWWAVFLLLVAGGIAVLVGSITVLRELMTRSRERHFLTRLHPDDAPALQDEEAVSYRQLQEKMLNALGTLEKAPELKKTGGLPLYAVPWYLLLGASQSGKTALLRSVATIFVPFARPSAGANTPTENCDWWFFNTAIMLDTAGRYALHPKGERDSAQWYRFLQLLRLHRVLQPINGLIITVAADALATRGQEELRLEATELRKRIDEAIRELGVDFPVYLLVTRCDMLEGFTEFFGHLPEHTLRQVFGYVNEAQPPAGEFPSPAVASPPIASIAETLVERLKQLRLSIFNAEKLPPATLRQRIFCFPDEFRALQQPLTVFVEALIAENPFQHHPVFRGMFFCSAQQQGPRHSFLRRQLHFAEPHRTSEHGAKVYFLHDLFAVILPRDQYLVRPTGKSVRGRLWRHLFGFGGCVVLCLLLLLFLTQAFLSDRRIHSAVNQELCTTMQGGQNLGVLLDSTERCRQVVQTLVDQNRQRFVLSKPIFNSSGRLEERLRLRYVEKFTTEVLAGLDAGISHHLSTGPAPIPLVFLLIKRIGLINQCLSIFGCPKGIEKDLQPDYQLMLDPARQYPPLQEHVARLRTTYETYLQWAFGTEEVLQREQEAHAEHLRRWLSARQFALPQILLWANQSYDPVTVQAYWEEAIPGVDSKKALQVDGAYTPGAWKQSILPFLQRARDVVPDMEPRLQEFQETYRTQYFEQWRRFLAEFPRPDSLSREHRRRLAVKLLDEHSPYNRILDVAFANLKPFLPAAMALESLPPGSAEGKPAQQPTTLLGKARRTVNQWWAKGQAVVEETPLTIAESALPAWVLVLHRYLKSESRKAYMEALEQLREPLSSGAPVEKSFQLVQAAFQEGKPTEKASHPVLKAWLILKQFRDKEGLGKEEEKVVWSLLEWPVRFVWRVLLEGAAGFLQKSWAENVVEPTKGLSEIERVNALYGPQGKVREFTNQFMKPFLVENGSRLDQVLGEELPLHPTFLRTLSTEKQLRPTLEQIQTNPPPIRVEASQSSSINGLTNLNEDRTELLLDCEGKTVKITNRPKDTSEAASASIPWSLRGCNDVAITVFVSCGRLCVDRATSVGIAVPQVPSLPITKRYSGPEGWRNFIKDFRGGTREFGVNDFAGSPTAEAALRQYHINTIRVFYRVEVPSTVDKLVPLIPTPLVPPAINR
jgi:type VI secretion system protein ImpL